VTEGVTLAFLALFFSCFFAILCPILRLVHRQTSSITSFMILPFTGCRFGGLGGSRGRVGTRAFAGHMTRFPASETCAFLSQFFTKLRGEFWRF